VLAVPERPSEEQLVRTSSSKHVDEVNAVVCGDSLLADNDDFVPMSSAALDKALAQALPHHAITDHNQTLTPRWGSDNARLPHER
jgi:hypothetical protein